MAEGAALGVAAAVSSALELHLVLIIFLSVFNSAAANVEANLGGAFLTDCFMRSLPCVCQGATTTLLLFSLLVKKKGKGISLAAVH